jgi:hypothetical protein
MAPTKSQIGDDIEVSGRRDVTEQTLAKLDEFGSNESFISFAKNPFEYTSKIRDTVGDDMKF